MLSVCILAAVLIQSAAGQANPKEVVLEGAVTITAEVVGIDYVDRNVALLGPEGNVVVVEVGYQARNFDEIEVGDQLKVEYYEAVAVFIDMHGNKPAASSALVTARSAAGEKPAGIAVETVDISARVQSIDRSKRSVTLGLHDGRVMTTKVDKSVEIYDRLKKGDLVNVRYTEAFAVSVNQP
jgi:hypothetical protein